MTNEDIASTNKGTPTIESVQKLYADTCKELDRVWREEVFAKNKEIEDNNKAFLRFFNKVDKSYGCWIWTGANVTSKLTYGVFSYKQKHIMAHRFSYEMFVEPIKDGMTIDHLCKTPLCVNPAHLRQLTLKDNILCGNSPVAKHYKQIYCKSGHLFDAKNTYISKAGHRQCRQCKQDWKKRKAKQLLEGEDAN